MLYRKFGKTNIEVSALGFGGMRFENTKNLDVGAALVQNAYNAGINYFDTAPMYCDHKSEEIFGRAFREMKKTRAQKPFYVSTKTFASTESQIRKDVENSLKRLGVDTIDFYHIWCILRPSVYRERVKNGVLQTFAKLKEEKLIRHICISSHMSGSQIAEVIKDYPFDGVLLGYSAMNFAYREEALEAAHGSGCGVTIMNPLGGGLIAQNPERFAFVKSRTEETVVEGALRFLLNDPRITLMLVGLSNQAQLQEAISAVEGYRPLTAAQVQAIREGIKGSFNELCTGCGYCKNCTQNIPILQLMDSYNQYLLMNKQAMIDRLKWYWGIFNEGNHLETCEQCGVCESQCTQKLPIMARLQEIKEEIQKATKKKK